MNNNWGDATVKGIRGSFASNTSTYYILLSKETEFMLYYHEAPAQVILDIKR